MVRTNSYIYLQHLPLMNRRKFITNVGIGFTVLPVLTGCESNSEWLNTLARPTTVTQFCDEKELLAIGNAYINKFPDEDSPRKLQRLLLEKHSPSSQQQLLEDIQADKAGDFKSGRTVIVNGWVLSRTEARQCALYTLTAKKN